MNNANMNNTNSNNNFHNILNNELTNNGWTTSGENNLNKFVYKNHKNTNLAAYNEFILDYKPSYEVAITVPIPYSSISYRRTFPQEDIKVIHEYLRMHLSNNMQL